MKYIQKSGTPQALSNWSARNPQSTYTQLQRNTAIKTAVKQSLMQEQGHICCYCERRISDDDSHIEHLRPQSTFPQQQTNYQNLLCSCQKNLGKGEPRHCGTLKGNWYNQTLFVSPLDPGCETRFKYRGDGEILLVNSNDTAARETIQRLGLNTDRLREWRKATIREMIKARKILSKDEFNRYRNAMLQKNNAGEFEQFYTVIQDFPQIY